MKMLWAKPLSVHFSKCMPEFNTLVQMQTHARLLKKVTQPEKLISDIL